MALNAELHKKKPEFKSDNGQLVIASIRDEFIYTHVQLNLIYHCGVVGQTITR